MSCCCENTLNLGCIGTCTDDYLRTGNNAPVTGIYTLHANFLNATYKIKALIAEGEEIMFPTRTLNENYAYSGYVTDPSGATISFISGGDGIPYDCISFETNIQFVLEEAELS